MNSTEKDKRVRTIGILAALGFFISIYLTKDHYAAGTSICDNGGLLSCSVVNRSSFSELLGVPVSIFGTIWCAVLVFGSWRMLLNDKSNYYLIAILLWSFLGILFIFYMVMAEFILGAVCIFCTAIHIITCIIFYHALKLFFDLRAIPTVENFVYTMRYVLTTVIVICITPIFMFYVLKEPQIEATMDFASCLTANNLRMFGSDSCGHCQAQKQLFGPEYFSKVWYTECTKTEIGRAECQENKIEAFPTWIKFVDGKEVERKKGYQSLDKLAEFSGCKRDVNGTTLITT